jgi:putative addiction module component (TIGR02574 family)
MARSARELFDEAMRLEPQERATLMRLLIEALDADTDEGVEDAWRVEIERRVAELDSGSVETIPWEEVRARLYRR